MGPGLSHLWCLPATAAGLLDVLLTMVIRTIARSFVVYLLSECTISAPQAWAFAAARILAFCQPGPGAAGWG